MKEKQLRKISMAGRDLRSFFGRPTTTKSSFRKRARSSDGSAFGACPLCGGQFPHHKLERHAATCEGSAQKDSPGEASVIKGKDSPGEDNFNVVSKNDSQKDIISPFAQDISIERPKEQDIFTLKGKCLKPTDEPISGLYMYEDFITEAEEAEILAALDDPSSKDYLPWKSNNFNGVHLGKRWGVHCNLRTRQVTIAENPLPWFVHDILIPKLRALKLPAMARVQWVPNEANAIDYHTKQGHLLKNHVDDRKLSKEPIANLSLAGDCYMTFINEKISIGHQANQQENGEIIREKRVLLKRRCLQVLSGPARYDFSHGIRHADLLAERRVSLTMRESPMTSGTTSQSTLQHIFHKQTRNV